MPRSRGPAAPPLHGGGDPSGQGDGVDGRVGGGPNRPSALVRRIRRGLPEFSGRPSSPCRARPPLPAKSAGRPSRPDRARPPLSSGSGAACPSPQAALQVWPDRARPPIAYQIGYSLPESADRLSRPDRAHLPLPAKSEAAGSGPHATLQIWTGTVSSSPMSAGPDATCPGPQVAPSPLGDRSHRMTSRGETRHGQMFAMTWMKHAVSMCIYKRARHGRAGTAGDF